MSVSLAEFPTWALVAGGVVVLASITLEAIALLDLYRRPTEQVVLANKWIWVALVVLVSTVGAIIYLAAGRKPTIINSHAGEHATPSARPEDIADALYGPRDETGER